MKIYIKYSNNYPYLPVAVADSPTELARMIGTAPINVRTSIYRGYDTYGVIEIEDEETEND